MEPATDLPLRGFRIISAEQYGAGPYGTMFLAQMGAEVIKIEPPGNPPPPAPTASGAAAAIPRARSARISCGPERASISRRSILTSVR